MKNVKVIAIGSGAQNIVSNEKAKRDFDVFSIESEMGSGNDEEKGRLLAESRLSELDHFVNNTKEKVFVVSTLGGGTGTDGTPVVVKHLADNGFKVVTVVTLPLNFEGELKYNKSRNVVKELSKACLSTIVINQENYMKRLGDKTIVEFFRIIDETVYDDIVLLRDKKKCWWKWW